MTARTCPGDCDTSGNLAVDKVLIGIRIVLGDMTLVACVALDANVDSEVSIDELVVAVNRALDGRGTAAHP